MKTFLVCAETLLPKHEGEEYDDFLVVPDIPAIEELETLAQRISQAIRDLWLEDTEVAQEERIVNVALDGHAAVRTIIIDLQVLMQGQEKVEIEFEGKRAEIIKDQPIPRA